MVPISFNVNILKPLVFLIVLFSFSVSYQSAYSTSQEPNPCLTASPEDYSSSMIMPSTTNSTLQNNTIPEVQNGQAKFMMPLQADKTIVLSIVLNLRHPEQFENCLASINDPASQNYHHFLNDTTIMPYLPTSGQKSSIASFLAASGFKVESTSSPLVLEASAPVSTAESTFGVTLKVYQVPPSRGVTYANNLQNMIHTKHARSFYAADSEPRLPSDISILVNSIQGLDNYTMVKPLESPCTGPYCPQGIESGYLFSNLYSKGLDGSGQNVAIIDCAGDPNPQSAIDTYDAQYGLAPTILKIFYPDGTPSSYDPSWASETMMDIEAVHTVAPGATIDLIYDDCTSGSPMNGIDYVAANHIAGILSNSWGFSCSSGTCSDVELSPSLVSSSDNRLALDAAQGLTILFASGDNGAAPDGTNLGTEFPASDTNVLAVGATDLTLTGCGTKTCSGYGQESGAQISGGGYSGYFVEPTWQTASLGTKSGRAVPDISILGYDPAFWVYSTNSDKCGSSIVSTSGWFGCAGTSLATPLWAGYLAIVQQAKGGGLLGNVAPTLYEISGTSSYHCSFHDVVSGNNIMSGGSSSGYVAGPGWDPVTGLGTPIADNLTAALTGGLSCISVPEFPFTQAVLVLSIVSLIVLYNVKPLRQGKNPQ